MEMNQRNIAFFQAEEGLQQPEEIDLSYSSMSKGVFTDPVTHEEDKTIKDLVLLQRATEATAPDEGEAQYSAAQFDEDTKLFMNTDPIGVFLNNRLYAEYQSKGIFEALEGLEKYYYRNYLELISQRPFALGEWLLNFQSYIEEFQEAVRLHLDIPEEYFNTYDSFLIKQELRLLLGIKQSVLSDENLDNAICNLGLSLHYLTEKQLEKSIEALKWEHSPLKTKMFLKEAALEQYISQILQTVTAIVEWSVFIKSIPSKHSQEACDLSDSPKLWEGYQNIDLKFNQKIIHPLKYIVEQFLNIAESVSKASVTDVFQLDQALQIYKDALDAIKVLKEIEDVALTEVLSKFNDEQAKFLSCCKSFLETKSNELFEAFETGYKAAKDNKQYVLFEAGSWWFIYKDLKKIIGIWDEFTELYNVDTLVYEKLCVEYRKQVQQWEQCQSKIGSLIDLLFSFLETIENEHPAYPPSNVAKEAFMVLKRLREVIGDDQSTQSAALEHKLYDEGYQEKFRKAEKNFRAYCWGTQMRFNKIKLHNNKKNASLCRVEKSDNKRLSSLASRIKPRYDLAESFAKKQGWEGGHKEFMKLCQGYFGDKWVDSNQHATAETALFASVSRLR